MEVLTKYLPKKKGPGRIFQNQPSNQAQNEYTL